MKKKILLFALIAAMAFSAIGVSAASAGDGAYSGTYGGMVAATAEAVELEYFEPDGDAYTIEYEVGDDFDGQWFGILVTEGVFTDEIGEIAYVDQTQVIDGMVTFEGFTPMVAPGDEGFVESTVYIGGDGFNGNVRKAIGILTDGTGADITGKALGADSVKVMKNGKVVRNVAITGDSFSVAVPAGEGYSVVYSRESYLDYTYTGIEMKNGVDITLKDVDMDAIEGLKGDFNADGQKTIEDLADLIEAFVSQESKYDIVGGDGVNVNDITAFLTGYGKCAVEVPYK